MKKPEQIIHASFFRDKGVAVPVEWLKEKIRKVRNNMYIIAGLGNPGPCSYEGTRHNAGFDVIDALADKYNISVDGRKKAEPISVKES